ncbi:hypothetical protein BKA82DRAFT_25946 [Pisolithus tinctorius]|uniref:Uncharacterized protein n=1 Tax=Pisolithus tinctorius Marx 270 TaxID=870435 RepID=A0A0C3J771_PISTI|nr:hypothetical protein BKA82DRAFT_25946 [Pisolithus tinctorius]KIO04868.1 hypothetical protein M404DRAFT_25946 [Pisolithus tinctorius Marx 270]
MAFDVYDDSNVVLLSGLGGSTLRTYNTSTGHLLERRLHSPARAETHESGDIARTWNSPDNRSLVVYSHIRTTSDTVYAIDNGSTIASLNIPGNLPTAMLGFVLLDVPMTAEITQALCSAWLESTSIRAAVLTQGLKGQGRILPRDGSVYVVRYNGESLLPMWKFTDMVPFSYENTMFCSSPARKRSRPSALPLSYIYLNQVHLAAQPPD